VGKRAGMTDDKKSNIVIPYKNNGLVIPVRQLPDYRESMCVIEMDSRVLFGE